MPDEIGDGGGKLARSERVSFRKRRARFPEQWKLSVKFH